MNHLVWCLFTISISISPIIALASNDLIEIEEGRDKYDLNGRYLVLKDPLELYRFEDVITPRVAFQFEKTPRVINNLGQSPGVYWLRVDFLNKTSLDKNYFLYIQSGNYSMVEAYVWAQGGLHHVGRGGYKVPDSKKDVPSRAPIFKVGIKSKERISVYLRLKTVGIYNIYSYLVSDFKMQSRRAEDLVVNSIYAGCMLALILYNFFILIKLRDIVYLSYIAFGLSMVAVVFITNGVPAHKVYSYFTYGH